MDFKLFLLTVEVSHGVGAAYGVVNTDLLESFGHGVVTSSMTLISLTA